MSGYAPDLEFFEYEEEPMSEQGGLWCVMCGAAPGEPCTTISGEDAGKPRPTPHFYRGSAEKPAVAVKDEPGEYARSEGVPGRWLTAAETEQVRRALVAAWDSGVGLPSDARAAEHEAALALLAAAQPGETG